MEWRINVCIIKRSSSNFKLRLRSVQIEIWKMSKIKILKI